MDISCIYHKIFAKELGMVVKPSYTPFLKV